MESVNLKDLLLANVNVKGLAVGILDQIVEQKLNELVQESSTPLDNIIKDAMWPVLRQKVLEKIDELVADLNK